MFEKVYILTILTNDHTFQQNGGNQLSTVGITMSFGWNNNQRMLNMHYSNMSMMPPPPMPPPMQPFLCPVPMMTPNVRFYYPMMGGPGFQSFGLGMCPNNDMGHPFANKNNNNRNLKNKKNHSNQKTPTQVKTNTNAKQVKPNPGNEKRKLRKKIYNAKKKNQNKYSLDAPFVTNEIKIEHVKKEEILDHLANNTP